jgi:regulatory protein YycH of two-component signal transduction system YycFG
MFEDTRLILKKLKEFVEIEKERNLMMKELSNQLGIDISFTDEEVFNNALDNMNKELAISLNKELAEKWMK